MIIFNYAGIIIAAIGFAVAFGIGAIVGTSAEGPLMMIAGPLIAILDLAYRFKSANGHWFIPHRGGQSILLTRLGIWGTVVHNRYCLRCRWQWLIPLLPCFGMAKSITTHDQQPQRNGDQLAWGGLIVGGL